MHIQYIHKCRSCGNDKFQDVIDLGLQYNQGSFIYPNKELPSKRKIPNKVIRCDAKYGCGLVQNSVSINASILYSNYGYQSSISETMRNHLSNLAKNIKKINVVSNPIIVDIGANDLYLLKQFSENWNKIGIDPCDIINNVEKEDITVINECFPCKSFLKELYKKDNKPVNIYTSIACFYDFNNPNYIVDYIKRTLASDGFWVVEFAYLPSVLENLAYDGMVAEHVCLYSLATLEQILEQNQLKLFNVIKNNVNGGSLQCWITHDFCNKYDNKENKNNILKIRIKEFDLKLDEQDIYDNFRKRVLNHSQELKQILIDLYNQKKKIYVLGMSTKLNTLLQYMNFGPEIIKGASERSLHKIGGSTLSGIPMVSEEEARKNADIFLVGPYHFSKEILSRERQFLENGGKIIFPLPEIIIMDEYNYKQYIENK